MFRNSIYRSIYLSICLCILWNLFFSGEHTLRIIPRKTIHAARCHGDGVAVLQNTREAPMLHRRATSGIPWDKIYIYMYPHLPPHLISQVSMDNEKQSQVLWESITNYKTLQQVLQACPSCEQSD